MSDSTPPLFQPSTLTPFNNSIMFWNCRTLILISLQSLTFLLNLIHLNLLLLLHLQKPTLVLLSLPLYIKDSLLLVSLPILLTLSPTTPY